MYNHMCSGKSPRKQTFCEGAFMTQSSWMDLEVDGKVCQGPGEPTLMEMTVLERDSRGVMAPVQPSPLLLSCPNWLPSSASPHTVKTRHWSWHNYAVEINYCGKKNVSGGIIHLLPDTVSNSFWLVTWLTSVFDFYLYFFVCLFVFKSAIIVH